VKSEGRPPDPQGRSTWEELDTRPRRTAHRGPRRGERRLLLIVLLVLAVGAPAGAWLLRHQGEQAGAGAALEASPAVAPQVYPAGTAAPALRLAGLDGGTLELAAYRGRPVLVNFWATWCAPCVREFPLLRRTLDEHRADGLVVLGVLVNDSPDKARAFVRQHGGSWPVGVDRGGKAVAAYKVVGLPQSVFVRRDGTLSSRILGELTPTQVQAQLTPILKR
jgi:cytochrome c biogenesis protein CcmG/thiol:disulfide interchange protein DsbE